MTRKEFIEKANEIYKNRFSYDKITNEKLETYSVVPIYCDRHGLFFQTVYHHLSGIGCDDCRLT